MPRTARIVIPNLPHHVTQRGNYRQNVFEEEGDYRKYAYLYSENAKKYKITTLAYCLMTNHVHFIVIPQTKDGLAQLFKNVHMQYSQYLNRKENKKGHLWQGRFFSCALSWEHLYSAVRYVERNPVRANIASKPWDYIWSSAKQHAENGTNPIIQTENPDQILEICGQVDDWKNYLVENDEKIQDEIRRSTRKGSALLN